MPSAESRAVYVFAHSAGGHKDDRAMLATTAALEPLGLEVVRFNFPYRERGSRLPDRVPELKAGFAAVVEPLRGKQKLILGGRSMGGRVATMLAADGFACDALLLFAYPLHPAGKPEKLRDAHLPAIRVPVLCFNGTRDALCRRDLMEAALQKVTTDWEMHWLEGADHSLTGKSVMDGMAETTKRWFARLH
jgi:predicted alpha/beta-hydrolase family hydrolase